jgi:polysaccharide pyruvyl transferase WcaK-like protein
MKTIILTNQHSDNRGDESAVVGVIFSLRKAFGEDTKIVIYLQSGSREKFLTGIDNVEEKSMLAGIFNFIEMSMWVAFKTMGIDIRFLCTKQMKSFLEIHEQTTYVISSCGGPYIGDIYINHEIFHILHMLIPQLLGKKTAFYAPSMGPFNNKFMNFFRRKMLKKTTVVTIRDPVSHEYLTEFLPERKDDIHLTTDACLAYEVDQNNKTESAQEMIGITPLDYNYPLTVNKQAKKNEYEDTIIRTLNTLMDENANLIVQFFPQLYANRTDVPFIRKIVEKLKYPERTIIFSEKKSGVDQQKEIAKLKYMIACRYHSAIFACKVNTPTVCIVYEHKAMGFMESVHLGEYCIDIYKLDEKKLLEKISLLNRNTSQIKKTLPIEISRLRNIANLTAELIYKS